MDDSHSAERPLDPGNGVPVDITVRINDVDAQDMDGVRERLRAAGMEIRQVLANVGVVTGSVPQSRLAAIQRVPGVEAVELDRAIQLPPPDSPIQ